MKIQRIHLYKVNVPEHRNWWSDDYYGQPEHQSMDHWLLEVKTDTGLVGLAELERSTPQEQIVTELSAWIGENVLEYNLNVPKLCMARSFEQIVLDLRGQALGVPIWQLLGGRLRESVVCTQCTGYKTPENTALDAQWGWEQGFRYYKMKCITSAETTPKDRIRYVVDRVEAIHRDLPDMVVRPDIRWRLGEVWVAKELANCIQGHAIDCLESPISKQAFGGTYCEWKRLRDSIPIPIADHVSDPFDLVRRFSVGAIDYAIVGGSTATQTLNQSRLAHDLGLGGWSQTVAYGPGAAMGLHIAACMPNLTQAYDMVGPMVWENDLTNENFEFSNGAFQVPNRPGLGFTLNHEAVKKYLLDEKVFEL